MVREAGGRDLRTPLLAALIFSAALLPPELSPAGLALAAALAAGAGILLLLPAGSSPGFHRDWRTEAAVLSAYLAIAVLTSPQPHRSLSFLLASGIGLVAFAAAFRLPGSGRAKEVILATVVATGSLVAAWGIVQRTFSLAGTARELRGLGRPELDPLILRAESGRAFGPFLLPSSLGIYLAMTLPLTLRFGFRSGWRGWRGILWASLLLLQMAGLGASVSYGALLSLVIASVPFLLRLRGRGRRWLLASAGGLAAAGAGAFLLLRGKEGAFPMTLRAGNWGAALNIFLGDRLLGVGFGGFADAYAGQMAAGMNETAFAHNSYLQIAAEGGMLAGVWAVLGAILLLGRVLRKTGSQEEGSGERLLALPVVAFLVHNLFDFSAYLPSLSITFAALAGVAAAGGRVRPDEGDGPRRRDLAFRCALLLLLLGSAAWGLREAQTRISMENGRAMLDKGKLEEAIGLLRRAERRDPTNPDPPALLAEIHLDPGLKRPGALSEGETYARRAVELRPRRAYGHYLLALYRLSAGDRGEAWTEISRARELFPSRELYAREESRLRELIASGAGPGKEPDAPH